MNNFLGKVHRGDCSVILPQVPDNSVDLVVADPPYNLSNDEAILWEEESFAESGHAGLTEDWDKFEDDDYEKLLTMYISECKRILKPGGSIWTFGTYHNIGLVNVLYNTLGVELLNEIIWYKPDATPNISGRRFCASHENILWGVVGDEPPTFNYEDLKSDSFKDDPINPRGKQPRSVWWISKNISDDTDHPTEKPEEVIRRIIKACSNEGGVVMDPFLGSGTTAVVAKQMGREWFGIERNEEYADIAEERIESTVNEVEQYGKLFDL